MYDDQHILTLSCRNRPGIVAAVSACIFERGGNIQEAHQYDDRESGCFFMRVVFNLVDVVASVEPLRAGLADVAARLDMTWSLRARRQKPRVLLMASRFHHCVADLLYRWRTGELPMELVGLVSNHELSAYARVDLSDVDFYHLPLSAETKAQQEAQVWRLVRETRADLVVLARYMQILSEDLAGKLAGRCINIHHSFLPGFKGARPYHQAHACGVKVIGATAHYVTADLDEGPIIEQDVLRISHHDSPDDLIRKGRDIERQVLARAVAFHLEGRVLLNGRKTVVFRD